MPTPIKKTGTGFTNLQKYLSANKNNTLGSTIASGINDLSGQVRTDADKALLDFGDEANKLRLDTDQNREFVDTTLQSVAGDNPSVSADQISKFSTLRAGNYAGPNEMRTTPNLSNRAEEAESLGKSVGSLGGRFSLLQKFLGGPSYSRGHQRLDSLLLGQDNSLKQARRSTVGLTRDVKDKEAYARSLAQGIQAGNRNFSKDIRDRLGVSESGQLTQQGMLGGGVADVNQRLQQELQQKAAQENVMRQALRSRTLTPEQRQELGVGGVTNIYNIDPEQYLAQTQNPTVHSFASPQEQARIAALSQLAGVENTMLPYAEQAGTYVDKPFDFRQQAFLNDIAQQKADYDRAWGAPAREFVVGLDSPWANDQPHTSGSIQDEYRDAMNFRNQFLEKGDDEQAALMQRYMDAIINKWNQIDAQFGVTNRLK
jgi:hypothetical protein